MIRKMRVYDLNSKAVNQMTETERKILVSIVKIELSRNSLSLENLDLEKLPEEQKEILYSLINEFS